MGHRVPYRLQSTYGEEEMTEYTHHTVGVARYELNGWYTLKELEQLVVDLKECNERARKAMEKLMEKTTK